MDEGDANTTTTRRGGGGGGGGGLKSFKSRGISARVSREKQRKDALSRQQSARRDFADHARRVALLSSRSKAGIPIQTSATRKREEEEEEEEGGGAVNEEIGEEANKRIKTTTEDVVDVADADTQTKEEDRGELQLPEYMTDVPTDLGENWLCQPKPRGTRCAVIAARGRTSAFDKYGKRIMVGNNKKHFQSALPGGSYQTRGNSETFCILDCVYGFGGEGGGGGVGVVAPSGVGEDKDDAMEEDGGNEGVTNRNYFVVLDVMAWNGAETYGCDVEFRNFWLQSKFASEIDSSAVSRDGHEYPMFPAPFFSCATMSDLCQCYEGARLKSFGGYACDGLIFRDKRASYTPGESTPLALLYKDEALCESCGEGTFRREILERGCFLKVKGDGSGGANLCAVDDDTVLVQAGGLHLNPNVAVRCEWEGDKLVPRGCCEKKGTRPDAFSRVQFYIACKTNPLPIEEIAATIS